MVVTPAVTPINQAMLGTRSGADEGWRLDTKKARSKGVPVTTSNHFYALNEEEAGDA